MGLVATLPLPCIESPKMQSGGQNKKRPTNEPGGFITRAI